MASVVKSESDPSGDEALYPIAVLIDELRNEDVQVLLQSSWFYEKQHHEIVKKLFFFKIAFTWLMIFLNRGCYSYQRSQR